jgi:hypothetical protein
MAGITSVVAILKALGLASWRDIRSFGSISGQNLFLFVALVALQPESAEFFALLFIAVVVFPLSNDPLQKVPQDRRMTWPIARWEWSVVRVGSLLLSPVTWIAGFTIWRAGWRMGAMVVLIGLSLFVIKYAAALVFRKASSSWNFRIPAPPGAIGSLMRLQWRGMLQTLDPYLAFSLMAATTLYRTLGHALETSAQHIICLVVVLAISTETQVLLSIDGKGAERPRQMPITGWRLLIAKDLAFLVLLAPLVAPLDFVSGMFGGLAALTIGHHRSVMKPIPQTRWRFTSGAIFPDGVIQTAAIFTVGSTVTSAGIPFMALCLAAWLLSIFFYGWRWDGQRYGQ